MSKKYFALGDFLRSQTADEVAMSFGEIEQIIGDELPNSQQYPAWWSNSPWNNVMTKVWLDAGFKSEKVDVHRRKLVFRRTLAEPAKLVGMAEDASEFRPADTVEDRKPRRSPLFGCMKGTFNVDPAWDVTKPALEPEEWAAWEASLDRKAGQWFGPK